MNERFDRALKRARQRGFDCGLAVNPTGELLVESRMRRERVCLIDASRVVQAKCNTNKKQKREDHDEDRN